MTRKDFELIARVIKELHTTGIGTMYECEVCYIACVFADHLKNTNERFLRERFLKACGKGLDGFKCSDHMTK